MVSAGAQILGVYLKEGSGSLVFSRHDFATSEIQVRKISSSTSQMKVSANELSTRLSMPAVAVNQPAPMYHKITAMHSLGRKTVRVVHNFKPLPMCVMMKL